MKLEIRDKNYCATVVCINKLVPLAGCDNIQHAVIFANSVIVSKDVKEGDMGFFFPVETKLSAEFIKNNNLYRDNTLNADTAKKGFFELNGRVRCCKMRGFKSEGFFIPLTSLKYLGELYFSQGQEFNLVDGHLICEKYVVREKLEGTPKKKDKKVVKKISRLVENQYRLMNDTGNLRKEVGKIQPDDMISVSNKYHGTSWAVGNVLVKRSLSFLERLAKFFGAKVEETEYGIVYSSRKVVKNGFVNPTPQHFYGVDVWGGIADEVKEFIPKGITLYGECVGYLASGAGIQSAGGKVFDYGCEVGKHRLLIYRITHTNPDGKVMEYSWQQIADFCDKYGLEMPKTFYYGQAKMMFPELDPTNHWHENFLEKLEKTFIKEQDCPLCNNKVPEEGLVLSVETLEERNSYKLKNFRFLAKETEELDKGNLDMESAETLAAEEEV